MCACVVYVYFNNMLTTLYLESFIGLKKLKIELKHIQSL